MSSAAKLNLIQLTKTSIDISVTYFSSLLWKQTASIAEHRQWWKMQSCEEIEFWITPVYTWSLAVECRCDIRGYIFQVQNLTGTFLILILKYLILGDFILLLYLLLLCFSRKHCCFLLLLLLLFCFFITFCPTWKCKISQFPWNLEKKI